jgi:hypothetical protein
VSFAETALPTGSFGNMIFSAIHVVVGMLFSCASLIHLPFFGVTPRPAFFLFVITLTVVKIPNQFIWRGSECR